MSRITELINCVKIYNLCNHCDHFKCGECSVDDVNCKEEIEKQIVAEIKTDGIREFAEWLSNTEYVANHDSFILPLRGYFTIDEIVKEFKEQNNG